MNKITSIILNISAAAAAGQTTGLDRLPAWLTRHNHMQQTPPDWITGLAVFLFSRLVKKSSSQLVNDCKLTRLQD